MLHVHKIWSNYTCVIKMAAHLKINRFPFCLALKRSHLGQVTGVYANKSNISTIECLYHYSLLAKSDSCNHHEQSLEIIFFMSGCVLSRYIQKEIALSEMTAISYWSTWPQCFIYRTPYGYKKELHNEYTNAFQRIDLESCVYQNAFWLHYLYVQCADSQEGK